MSDVSPYAVPAIVLITVATLAIGAFGYRISRNTSDFLVASRTVSPRLNASAISGEYLSAASFLGVAGLIMTYGVDMLWYPVGFTAGYLAMLLYVAAPLRRSGAYTLPDFAQARLRSTWVRALATGFVVLIGWLYLVPQLQGAGLTLSTVTGAPAWVGAVVVGVVVTLNVAVGGMRSITFVQAFQYWVKLTAIAFPAMVLLLVWFHRDGAPVPPAPADWAVPLAGLPGEHPLFATYSLILATFLGTMGLPHVLVRFYTNPDGRAARTTTLVVLGMLGVFYLFPTVYGALGRIYVPELLGEDNADAVVLVLPGAAVGGLPGDLLSGLVAAGAFAAFLSTSSGLLVSVSGVLSTDVLGRWSGSHGSVRDFRRSAMVAGIVPLVLALQAGGLSLSTVVGLAFAVAASTFCPLLVLGIWWRGLTAPGAATGLVVGGALAAAAVLATFTGLADGGWPASLLAQPAAWTVPVTFAVMVGVSLATRDRIPADVGRTMLRLHAPESLGLDRRP